LEIAQARMCLFFVGSPSIIRALDDVAMFPDRPHFYGKLIKIGYMEVPAFAGRQMGAVNNASKIILLR